MQITVKNVHHQFFLISKILPRVSDQSERNKSCDFCVPIRLQIAKKGLMTLESGIKSSCAKFSLQGLDPLSKLPCCVWLPFTFVYILIVMKSS